jgi:flagellar basal body rod protein FlgB
VNIDWRKQPYDAPDFPVCRTHAGPDSEEQQALSANVANADTPGYHATDFSFQEELSAVQLEATHESHQACG